jgi:predicted HicB family RNase H-like nuclease
MTPVSEQPFRKRSSPLLLRMEPEDKARLVALAEHEGVSMTDVLILMLRRTVREKDIKVKLEHRG